MSNIIELARKANEMTESQQFCHDLELTELAAKAAGMRWVARYYSSLLMEWGKDQPSGKALAVNGMYSGWAWNPIADDGDALRLAVKLRLCLFLEIPRIGIGPMLDGPEIYLDEGDDPYTETRRAIVRTAAAIGEKMP